MMNPGMTNPGVTNPGMMTQPLQRLVRWLAAALLCCGAAAAQTTPAQGKAGAVPASAPAIASVTAAVAYRPVPGGSFRTVLPPDGKAQAATVGAFSMRVRLVGNAEYRDFLLRNPAWQRGRVATLFADASYLEQWPAALDFAPLALDAPVTQVSWFAASAFCASEGARLPRWYEWEYVAAADETRPDARLDAAWLARILAWYARPANSPPGRIGQSSPNWYGVHDIHNLVWEWVEDFNGLFVTADSRGAGQAKLLEYCGGAALSLADKENYAVLMRLALLGAMDARRGGNYLGFRCVRDGP